jgi:ubiquinone biosynthesis protein COQ9
MIDETTTRGRIIAAAIRLAGERPWSQVTLAEIAEAAKTDLAGLRAEFSSKSAILSGFTRAIDDQMLKVASKPGAGQAARDRVFEVVMARIDALQPYKAALKSIMRSGEASPRLACSLLSSQTWMLHAAGIGTDGPKGAVRVAGLASVYGSVLRTWLDDNDPGLPKTMATLDRRLRRGERTLGTVDSVFDAMCRVASCFSPGRRAKAEPAAGDMTPPAPTAPPAPVP